jgi:hypothetical protein
MTQAHWDQLFKLHFKEQRKRNPSMNPGRAREIIWDSMVASFGPRPAGPSKPPAPVRVGLWALSKKLRGLPPVGVPMFAKKLIVAAIYGIGDTAATLQLALADSMMTGDEWAAVVSAFVAAFWGKFSSNTTIINPSRKGETIHGTGDGR